MSAPPRAAPTLGRRVRQAGAALIPAALLVTRGARGRGRAVALTFDDGPDELSLEYLDLLDRYGARATFFVVGQCCAQRSEVLWEMVRRGHQVASHGYTHQRFPSLPAGALEDELERTAQLLPVPEGRPVVRPPGGELTLASLARTARAGYTTVLWSLDSDDCRTRSPETVAARLEPSQLRPGEIVLLHEGQRWTLEALPTVLEGLARDGWRTVTVDELLR